MWRRKRSAGNPDAARSGLPEGQHVEDASFTQSYTAADFARDQEEAQRNALAEASIAAAPRDASGQPAEEQLGWCSANGLFAGLSGGALGAVYGLGSKLITEAPAVSKQPAAAPFQTQRCRVNGQHGYCCLKRRVVLCMSSRPKVAQLMKDFVAVQSFAIMGGIYAAVTCWASRIRQQQDSYNSAMAGGVTGLVLGWGGGPAAALQSAIGFAAFSYVMDRLQPAQEAQAAAHLGSTAQIRRRHIHSGRQSSEHAAKPDRHMHGVQQLLLEACAAADNSLQPMGAFIQAAVTPAAAMLRPVTAVLAPCNGAAPPGACRRATVQPRRRQWRR